MRRLVLLIGTFIASMSMMGSAMAICTPDPEPSPPVSSTATDKVLVIVLENHSLSQIQSDAPYAYGLGMKYGMATNMRAAYHPSKPNYAVMAAGSNMGITSDSNKRVKGQSIFGAIWKAGRQANTMAESMGSDRCRHGNYGKYVEKHNPQEFFSDESAPCERYNFSYDTYGASNIAKGKLVNVGFLIPNQCNNAHDCSLATFDTWLKTQMTRIFAGPNWKAGDLTVVITADEDNRKNGNVVPFIVVNPNLKNKVVDTPLTHYGFSGMLSQFGGIAPMRSAVGATNVAAAFGLNIK